MTEDRLFELIETWGAETAAWPADERDAARKLLAERPERFRAAIAAARALDRMLETLPEAEVSPALAEAIIAAAPRRRAVRTSLPRWFGLKATWAPVGGLAAMGLGLVMGLTVAPAASAADDLDTEVQELVMSALGFDMAYYAVEDEE